MEKELAEAARAGDRQAFEELVRAHVREMLQFAEFVLHDRDGAQDAVQDGLLAAWRARNGLKDPTKIQAWLRQIVFRECLRWRRSFSLFRPLSGDQPATSHPAGMSVDIERALRHLPPKLRAVVFLHYFGDQTLGSVASDLGIPESTVKTRLYEALRRLRQMLPGYEADLTEAQQ